MKKIINNIIFVIGTVIIIILISLTWTLNSFFAYIQSNGKEKTGIKKLDKVFEKFNKNAKGKYFYTKLNNYVLASKVYYFSNSKLSGKIYFDILKSKSLTGNKLKNIQEIKNKINGKNFNNLTFTKIQKLINKYNKVYTKKKIYVSYIVIDKINNKEINGNIFIDFSKKKVNKIDKILELNIKK